MLSDWFPIPSEKLWHGSAAMPRHAFQIYGKADREKAWRIIDVYATSRRNRESRWPFCRGTCTTWSAAVVSVGRDFACELLREQDEAPASVLHPVTVTGGRLRDAKRRMS